MNRANTAKSKIILGKDIDKIFTPHESQNETKSKSFETPGGNGKTSGSSISYTSNDNIVKKLMDNTNVNSASIPIVSKNSHAPGSSRSEFKLSKGSKFSRGRVLSEYNVAMKHYIKYRKMMHYITVNGENNINNKSAYKALLLSAKLQFFKVKDICEEGLSSNGDVLDPCLLLYKARALSCVSVVEDAMGEIHAAVIHGHEAAQLFQSMNEDEKEYQTLANTYIAKIRVYTDEKIRNSDHLRVAHKYVLRMLTIAKKTASQAKEIDRLKRRISNITATLRGQKTIEWISGKGNVRKVVFRDAKKKVTNDDVTIQGKQKRIFIQRSKEGK